MEPSTVIGIDVGGTFTDIVGLDHRNRLLTVKTPSNPSDPASAVLEGIRMFASAAGVDASRPAGRCDGRARHDDGYQHAHHPYRRQDGTAVHPRLPRRARDAGRLQGGALRTRPSPAAAPGAASAPHRRARARRRPRPGGGAPLRARCAHRLRAILSRGHRSGRHLLLVVLPACRPRAADRGHLRAGDAGGVRHHVLGGAAGDSRVRPGEHHRAQCLRRPPSGQLRRPARTAAAGGGHDRIGAVSSKPRRCRPC